MMYKGLLQMEEKRANNPKEMMAENMNRPIHERKKASGHKQMKRCSLISGPGKCKLN